ncbi:MAG TPA: hypothetical protein VMF14_03530 [Solirubrobacteraceae bacterium]|nr:hypothetical protein [Solirubrobacteraceae bacterium]
MNVRRFPSSAERGLGVVGVTLALACTLVLSACGGSGSGARDQSGGGTSIADAVIAFVAPRDGADTVIGAQLEQFAQTVQSRLLGDCMTSDGFAAPALPTGGPPTDLGDQQFPNLPVIEATHDLGLFTSSGPFFNPQQGMSAPERKAWLARISRCFQKTQRQSLLFGSPKLGPLTGHWYAIVNQVSGSSQIKKLSKKAAKCSAAHGVPATSVQSLYGRLQAKVGPLSSSNANSTKVQALQAKGASVLAACWTKVINTTTDLLTGRRATYLAQNATAVSALQSQINRQVAALQRQYGIKLTVVGS